MANPEHGEFNKPVEPGTSSTFLNNRMAIIDAAKKYNPENKRKGNKKLKVFVSTQIKTYYKTTKYTLKDIANLEI